MTNQERGKLWEIGMGAIRSLEVEQGILASSKTELYGCVFGRDSLITSLLLLRAYEHERDEYFPTLVRKILVELAKLQGREENRESGEEPGKIIHEFRPEGHERLTGPDNAHPWYLYPDGIMRSYDTVDATPLFLLTLVRYYDLTEDAELLLLLDANIREALEWILTHGLREHDGFISYSFNPLRSYGGLRVQSWMDSEESIFFEDSDVRPEYSIAPVEVQAYAYAALLSWAIRYAHSDPAFAERLRGAARKLKDNFNNAFVVAGEGEPYLAYAIDGEFKQLTSPRSSMGHVLFADTPKGLGKEGILEERHVRSLARRLMEPDLFVRQAGIRTLSSKSRHYLANSYHNGSIWPHDTFIVADGLNEYGFRDDAQQMREALLNAYQHFQTPIELFVYNHGFEEYKDAAGHGACRTQAWSAAALLATLAIERE